MKHVARLFPLFALCLVLTSCGESTPEPTPETNEAAAVPSRDLSDYPAAPGFDTVNSDPKSIQIANEVMREMGGYEAYTNTRYFYWDFFGMRNLLWDKQANKMRVDWPAEKYHIVLDMNTMEGRCWQDTVEITDTAELADKLATAHSVWINDSYWLVMPFKMKDSGLTTRYIGQYPITEGELTGTLADVVELTFDKVGDTPENKYHVFVPTSGPRLIRQWNFFPEAAMDSAIMMTPWDDYQKHGELLLSHDRGEYQIGTIKVLDSVPADAFESRLPPVFE